MSKHKRRKKNKAFFNYICVIIAIISIIVVGLIYYLSILPMNYFGIIVAILFIINLIIIKLLKAKKNSKRIFGLFLALLLAVIEILGINYELNTLDFFKNFGFSNYKTENYNVVVLNDSFKKLEQLNNKDIGHMPFEQNDGLKKAISKLNKKINFEDIFYNDIVELTFDLVDQKIDAIILEDSQLGILEEENYELFEQLKTIYTFAIDIEVEDITKEVDVTNTAYNIYISGIDTYGKITKVSRSDVNIIATVNPNTHKILLTSIPRDYYITLSKYNSKDKLTHAGIYGIETSVGSLENLLDIKINYYIKVNFTSLIKVVDALEGIEVESNYAFTSKDGYYYKKGLNALNGKKALSFVRERKAFQEGDRTRGQNQQLVLTAILNKAMSSAIISKYNDLLAAVDGSFITNMDDKDLTKIIKNQIKEQANWQIESISLDGKDAFDYTYSYKRNKLYVMYPNEESITTAKNKIKAIIK